MSTSPEESSASAPSISSGADERTPAPPGSEETGGIVPEPIKLVAPVTMSAQTGLRLDLGAGAKCRDGFESVDIRGEARHKVDLFKFPWPWQDGSVEELASTHLLQYLPLREVSRGDLTLGNPQMEDRYVGKDFFVAFFNECHRVLVPRGKLNILVPNARSSRGFQDPLTRRHFMGETFLYLNATARKGAEAESYGFSADFEVSINPLVVAEMTFLHQEAATRRMAENWNVITDWQIVLTKAS